MMSFTINKVCLKTLVSPSRAWRATMLCSAAGLGLCSPAQAQTAPDDAAVKPAGGVGEIVVTAERRSASIQTVPLAVTALDSEALVNRQVTQTQDLQAVVPSLRLTQNVTSPTNLQPSLRGSVEQNGGQIPTESPVGIYIDDVYISSLVGNNVTLSDVERVEVLRGPQGTLYGRNSLAGAIKFITRTPGEDLWVNASAGYGNYNRYDINGSVGGPLGSGWAASLSAKADGHRGYFDNVATGRTIGREENYAVRGKLHYFGSAGFDAVLSLSYADSSNDGTIEPPANVTKQPNGQFHYSDLVFTAGGPYKVNTPVNPLAFGPVSSEPSGKTKQLITSLNMSYKIGGATLRSITAYVRTDDAFTTDLSGNGGFILGSSVNLKQFTQELQLQGDALDSHLHYITGLYYLNATGFQDFGWQIGIPLSRTFTNIKTKSYAAYGQLDYDLTDRLTATVGARWLRDEKSFTIALQGLVVPSAGPLSLNNDYQSVTPRFGLKYRLLPSGIIDRGLLYANISRGFKPGGYNNGVVVNLDDARSPYGPSTAWSYEVGAKLDLLDNHVRLNTAAFLQRTDGLQLTTTVVLPGGGLSFPVQNAGTSRVEGLEVDATVQPTQNLQISANATFLDGKYLSFVPGSAAANAQAQFGSAKPPQLAPYVFDIGFNYDIPLSSGSGASKFSVGGDWYRSGRYLTDATNASFVDPYSRVNAYLAFAPAERWEIRLSAKNLLDDHTVVSGTPALGSYIVLPPREYMLTVRYRL